MKKKGKNTPGTPFSAILLRWHREQNTRTMPWKGEKNAYRIWLSEIILQQTRVEQGLAYYERFIATYPSITDLAAAPDTAVLKLWEGLGYYSRCRNLIATARIVANDFNGQFPGTYDDIRSLKGIGPYTAAAIASFAFNLPYAVLDGNVFRVLARIFGIDTPIDSTAGKKQFAALAQELLDKEYPALYNQAIMDFGAVICKPAAPLCPTCVFQHQCVAFQQNRVATLPVKEKKIRIRQRHFNYFVLHYGDQWLIRERTARDIWQQLYEFPLIETESDLSQEEVMAAAKKEGLFTAGSTLIEISDQHNQQLSHQHVKARFIHLRVKSKTASKPEGEWIATKELSHYPFPRLIRQYLDQYLA
jgi:A/G-specific adenine glycosylase